MAWILAVPMTIPLLAGCFGGAAPPEEPAETPPGQWSAAATSSPRLFQILGDPSTSGLSAWPGQFDNGPISYDFNGDGIDEIAAHSTDRHVYVFDAMSGRALARLHTTYPPAWHVERVLNGVQAGVLSPGQPPSLIIANHAAYVSVWTFDPVASTKADFVFKQAWERRLNDCHRSPSMDAAAAVGDLDGDGTLEIVVNTEEQGFYALNHNGTIRWKHCWSGGNSAPVIADMYGDGRLVVIVASDSGTIAVLDGANGRPRWTFRAADHPYSILPGSVAVSPTVADLDGTLPKEIIFVARYAPQDDPTQFADFNMAIFAIRQNSSTYQTEVVWMRQPAWANPLSNTRLVVKDVDGDGAVEIFGMDWNTIGHRPGSWERLGPANVFRLDAEGNDIWIREVDAWWSNQDILLADSDGDGEPDVLVNGPGDGGDGIWRLSAETGSAEGFLGTAPWKMLRGPVAAQLREDGAMHLLVSVVPMEDGDGRGAILVYGLDPAAGEA